MSDPRSDPLHLGDIDIIVTAALEGNATAVDGLLRIVRPLVVRYCRSRLGGYERLHASPDDVAQEVCLAVLQALPTYRDQGRPFLAFVYNIAQHKVIDAHRSAGRDRSHTLDALPEEQDSDANPEQHALDLAGATEMAKLLAELPEKQRRILQLRVVMGLSTEETAETMGTTAGAVRVAQHKAIAQLREVIATRAEGADLISAAATPRTGAAQASNGLAVETFIDSVLAESEDDSAAKLQFEIEGVDPKEFKTYNAVVEEVRSLVNVDTAIAQVVDRYRHRQLTKDVGALAGPLDAGIAAAIAARKRGVPGSAQSEKGGNTHSSTA